MHVCCIMMITSASDDRQSMMNHQMAGLDRIVQRTLELET